jgi:enoyl-CoA hydratase/carnithine racemase
MPFEHLATEESQNVAKLIINRPEKLNAMSERTRYEIISALKKIQAKGTAKSLIITGAGNRAFSAGQDLEESREFSPQKAREWVRQWGALYRQVLRFPHPIVTATPGYAVGAGWQLYLLGDYRVASRNAKFGMTEIDIGIPCITGSAILESMIGLAETSRLTLMAEILGANEAKKLGLVHDVVPIAHLKAATFNAAKKLAEKPPTAMKLQKRWLNRLLWERLKIGVAHGKLSHTQAFASGEPQKYMIRFLNKRSEQ